MNFMLERMYKNKSHSPPQRIIIDKPGKSYTCGRGKKNNIMCLSLLVSRNHCIFFHSNDALYVLDLHSSNGIFINGMLQQNNQMIKLHENDIIGIGCAGINSDDHTCYLYKIGIIKSPRDKETENGVLTETFMNNDVSLKRPASVEHPRKECSSKSDSVMDCDIVPCKIPKYEDEDFSRIIHSKEINPDENNQSSYISNNENSINDIISSETKTDVKIEDDIEIVHTSFAKTQFDDCNDSKLAKHSKSNYNTYQCSTKLSENSKKEISIDIDMNDNDNNTRSVNNSNFMHTEDRLIKVENELQVNNNEARLSSNTNDTTICEAMPIKLKKVTQEIKTRFSDVDVVDLSDDEDVVFPYSQLFDTKYENDAMDKIKQECTDIADQNNEKIGLLNVDDEVIILTDDEDEDNPWLERLSRSQLLNEDKQLKLVVKEEIDLGIWETEDILNTIQSNDKHIFQLPDNKAVSLTSNVSEKDNTICKDARNVDLSATKTMDISDSANEISLTKIDNTRSSEWKTDAELHVDNKQIKESDQKKELDARSKKYDDRTKETNNTIIESIKSKLLRENSVKSKKMISLIEAQNLPVKRRNRIDHSTEKQKEKPIEKKQSKSMLEKEMLKLKRQSNENICSKVQKLRKEMHKSASNCSSQSKAKTETFISKEQKNMIMEMRKIKLKEIAKEEKKLTEVNKTVKRRIAKPKAKISLKNRSDFLITDRNVTASKPLRDKSTEASTRLNSNDKQLETLPKKCVTSDAKTQKSYQKGNDILNSITMSLQQSLRLSDIASTIQVTERTRENNVQQHETIDEEKKSNKRKVHDSAQSNKQKKKVIFSEKVEIKYYEIETQNSLKRLVGKDAPIPTTKLSKTMTTTTCIQRQSQCPKLEQFLLRIFLWNPIWLEEQRFLKCIPPIVSADELQPIKLSYASYEEYYNIMIPLLLLEVWHVMSKDFENREKNMQRITSVCSIVENSVVHIPISSTVNLTSVMIEILVEKEGLNRMTHPIYGDLVSFEYVKNIDGRQMFHKVFAYITHMHETVITDFSHYNKNLRNYVNKPYAIITYTLLMRSFDDIAVNKMHRVRTITYLRANIRMVQALQYLPQSSLLNSILNPQIENYQLPEMNEIVSDLSLEITEKDLNKKQMQAVCRVSEVVLRKESKLCFIQGPPGTGKSKVIVNLVSRILYSEYNKKSLRILVCAPSNAAIDEIVLRLLAVRSTFKPKRFNMVRIGRPESMHPTAKSISVTELAKRYIIQTASQPKEAEVDLQTRMNSIQNTLTNSNMNIMKRKEREKKLNDIIIKYEIMKLLNGETLDKINAKVHAKIQRLSEDMILRGADVITCTLSSCYTNQMESIFGDHKDKISVCIVDEATQSCEAETLIPLMLGVNTLVLVGDPNQLPATILSQQAKKLGLDQSVFSRMQNVFASQQNNPIIMLNTQYRMNPAISFWPNKYFYGGKLKNEAQIISFPFYNYRILNHNFPQNHDKFSNTMEAKFVANIIFSMLAFAKWDNVHENSCFSIGILTPYNIQKTIVQDKINKKISALPENLKKKINFDVNTVDGFQGQERDIIILSCVRSHGIGFLSDKQRLCVALTRAKQSLILCGNFNTFMKDQMWKALLVDAQSRGNFCNVDAHATPISIKPFIIK